MSYRRSSAFIGGYDDFFTASNGRGSILSQDAVQPVLPDGAGAGRKTVALFKQMEHRVSTTKPQTTRVWFHSFGRVKLILAARDVQHGGPDAAGALVVPIAGQRSTEGGHAADGIRVGFGKAIV